MHGVIFVGSKQTITNKNKLIYHIILVTGSQKNTATFFRKEPLFMAAATHQLDWDASSVGVQTLSEESYGHARYITIPLWYSP